MADTGLTWEDYGSEVTAEEIRDMICAGWDGEDVYYYDNCAETVEEQYYIVFGGFWDITDNVAMTEDDIMKAISTPWNGQTSQNPAAMSAREITEAVNKPWNGQASTNPAALSATEITEVIKNIDL